MSRNPSRLQEFQIGGYRVFLYPSTPGVASHIEAFPPERDGTPERAKELEYYIAQNLQSSPGKDPVQYLEQLAKEIPDKGALETMLEQAPMRHAGALRKRETAAADPYITAAQEVLAERQLSLSPEMQADILDQLKTAFQQVARMQAATGASRGRG